MRRAVEELEAAYPEAVLWTPRLPPGQRFYTVTGWTLDGNTRDNGSQV